MLFNLLLKSARIENILKEKYFFILLRASVLYKETRAEAETMRKVISVSETVLWKGENIGKNLTTLGKKKLWKLS